MPAGASSHFSGLFTTISEAKYGVMFKLVVDA
ncbi:MAG: hypothetical protein BWY83_03270 [bacterium ADurb.Bin478]|nr:MAG: hypothetical protein BWY83_03270 [bacterium ADurb.Bin478]